eukprot:1175026-Pyramimonas_sp.AAC.1
MGRRRHANWATGTLGKTPIWGHETCKGYTEIGQRRHANCATGTLYGAPYGATKRVRGVPKWGGATMRELRHWDLRWSYLHTLRH